MYAHMELIYFFLVVDLLPLGLFLWIFRHLPPKGTACRAESVAPSVAHVARLWHF